MNAEQHTLSQNKYLQAGKHSLFKLIFSRTTVILLALAVNFLLVFSIAFSWIEKLPILLGGVEIFTAIMLMHILNNRDNPSIKLSWCIVIAVLGFNFVGDGLRDALDPKARR